MSDHRFNPTNQDPSDANTEKGPNPSDSTNPLVLLDECLATLPEHAPQQKLLYKIRHFLLQQGVAHQQQEAELKKLQAVVEKLTAPANRIGMLLDVPQAGIARISVGGSEFYTNIDPRLQDADLKIGEQILVNEAYVLIQQLGYDQNGPILRIKEALPDGRLRIDQEPGRQSLLLHRSSDLANIDLQSGDEVRIDPGYRLALEYIGKVQSTAHVLDEVPSVTWNHIGGQSNVIEAIRRAIEYPVLHAHTYSLYQFTQPKGFLLYGPPGCGKTLIGQATANSLAKLVAMQKTAPATESKTEDSHHKPPVTGGAFLHVKGPEILNMWVGESERMIRDVFVQARERRKAGLLPFIFIDEAESILGTRRALRSYNISNTLVPMFCAELDGIESLQDVVVILASNRPDLIDPAVLRPGRIDRKIKVNRPGREEAAHILRIYLTEDLPYDQKLLDAYQQQKSRVRDTLIQEMIAMLFSRTDDNRLLAVHLRNGKRETLYRCDLLSGAILASIIQRAKERAIERTVQKIGSGLSLEDIRLSIQDEFREGEILPPDEAAEEWLKLLDQHPDQVIGVSSFRHGRHTQAIPVRNII